MAPEVLRNGFYSDKVDVYALGCVIFYLITGNHLFRGHNQYFVLKMNAIGNISEQLERYSKRMSSDLIEFLKWLLATDPNKRPSA